MKKYRTTIEIQFNSNQINMKFRENNISILDTGIDCSNLTDSIVQCKLRKETYFSSTYLLFKYLFFQIIKWVKN